MVGSSGVCPESSSLHLYYIVQYYSKCNSLVIKETDVNISHFKNVTFMFGRYDDF